MFFASRWPRSKIACPGIGWPRAWGVLGVLGSIGAALGFFKIRNRHSEGRIFPCFTHTQCTRINKQQLKTPCTSLGHQKRQGFAKLRPPELVQCFIATSEAQLGAKVLFDCFPDVHEVMPCCRKNAPNLFPLKLSHLLDLIAASKIWFSNSHDMCILRRVG